MSTLASPATRFVPGVVRRAARRVVVTAVLLVAVAGVGVANAAPADAPMVGSSSDLTGPR